MPIDFPSLPLSGQVYTYISRSWMYNGTGWQSIPYITSGSVVSGSLAFNVVFSGNIASGQIGWPHIASGAITSGDIASGAVVSDSIASGQITGNKVAASTIANVNLVASTITIAGSSTALGGSWAAQALTTSSGLLAGTYYPSGSLTIGIASGGIVAQMMASGAVLSGSIGSGQIGASHLASGTLQSAPATLSSGQVTSGFLGNASVVSGSIGSGQIGAIHLASGTLQSAPATLSSGQVTSGFLGNASVVSGSIASGQVSRFHIANASIFSGHISSSEVGSIHLASGAVVSGKIGDNAVTSGNIASGQVGTPHIAAGSILSGQIGANVIGSPHILAGSILNASLQNSSITVAGSPTSLGGSWIAAALTTSSGLLAGTYYPSGSLTIGIASGGVVAQMLASGSILSGSIGSGQIGASHLASGTLQSAPATLSSGQVTSGFLGNASVVSGSIASGQVGTFHHQTASILSGQIGANVIGSPHILAGSITNTSLQNSAVTIAGASTSLGGTWAAAALTTASGLLAGTYYPSGALTIGVASGGINSSHIASGAVVSGDIGNSAVVSGSIASGSIGGVHLASGALGIAGSSGQIQFNAGGTLGASAAVTFASTGPNLGITTQGTGNIPLRITTASGHTTNSLEIYHSGALSARISPDGYLYVTQQLGGAIKANTVINGSLGNPNVQYRSTVLGAGCSVASGAGVGEATALGFASTAAGQYSTAIGYGANAGNTSVALGFLPSATATRAIAIGDIGTANQTNSCAFGTRATVTGAGNFAWATESSDPSMTFQRLNGSVVLKGLYNINTTWISNTNGAEISRVTFGPMYANSMQEAIRMDAASDLARVGMGGPASGRLCVYTGAATNKGVVIQAFTSQSANLTEWQDSAGTPSCVMTSSGNLIMGNQTAQGFTLEVARANNFSFTGTAYRVACFNATTAAASDRPGIQLGYDTAGAGIVAAATNSAGSDLAFWTYNGSAWAEKSRIAKDGKFGIGTSSPQALFHVSSGQAYFDSAQSDTTFPNTEAGITIKNTNATSGNYGTIYFANASGGVNGAIGGIHNSIATGTGRRGGLGFGTAGSNSTGSVVERMRLNTEGYLGINSSTPSGQFQISNSTAALIPAIIRGAASQTANLLELQDSSFNVVASVNRAGGYSSRPNTTALTASQNNYAFDGSSIQRVSSNGNYNITGITYPSGLSAHSAGRFIRLYNINAAGGNSITLVHNSSSSSTGNKFWNVLLTDIVLGPLDYAELIYDDTDNGSGSAGWRVH